MRTAFAAYALGGMAVALLVSLAVGYVFSIATENVYYGTMPVRSGLYVYDSSERALVPAESVNWYDAHSRTEADAQDAETSADGQDAQMPDGGEAGADANAGADASATSGVEIALSEGSLSKRESMGVEVYAGEVSDQAQDETHSEPDSVPAWEVSVYVANFEKESSYYTPVYIDDPPDGISRLRIEDVDGFSPESAGSSSRFIDLEEIPSYDRKQNVLRGGASAFASSLPETSGGTKPVVSLVGYYLYSPVPPLYTALSILMIVSVPAVFLVCFFLTSRAFYRAKLEKPIKTMDAAAQRIASGDLDFKLAARAEGSKDELDALCDSFESMRSELDSANRAMWRAAENRRRVNAAFAHDLRTPLTVLKGRAEMLGALALQGSLDSDFARETACAMARQVNRLERYVESMRDLSALDEYRVDARAVAIEPWFASVSKEAAVYAADAGLAFESSSEGLSGQMVALDESALARIVENAVANACRYAASRVTLRCSWSDGELFVRVSDDGPGFGPEALTHACEPFWRDKARAEEDPCAVPEDGARDGSASQHGARPDQVGAATASQHFGLGLNICATLAEKLGGEVRLGNAPDGGAVVEARVSAPQA